MNWNHLEGKRVNGLYLGLFPFRGTVVESRVKYGGDVQHTVQLAEPIVVYGAVRELTRDRKYFYKGILKSEFTDRGKEVICSMLDMYAGQIVEAIEADDLQRSKELVLKKLKDSEHEHHSRT